MAVIAPQPTPSLPEPSLRDYALNCIPIAGLVTLLVTAAFALPYLKSRDHSSQLGTWLSAAPALIAVTAIVWIIRAVQEAAHRVHRRRFPEPLNAATLERLEAIGEVTERHRLYWKEIWWRDGPEQLESLLKRREEAAARNRELLPRLIEFATECRRAHPTPNIQDFTLEDQHEYEILLIKMRETQGQAAMIYVDRPDRVQIHVTTRVGLLAVQHEFPSDRVVALLPEERDRLLSQFEGDAVWEWNCVIAWWLLRRELSGVFAEYEEAQKLTVGTRLWEVEAGIQWGSMHGGSRHEFWLWDGRDASIGTFVFDTTF